jgi:hypothetical protein
MLTNSAQRNENTKNSLNESQICKGVKPHAAISLREYWQVLMLNEQ